MEVVYKMTLLHYNKTVDRKGKLNPILTRHHKLDVVLGVYSNILLFVKLVHNSITLCTIFVQILLNFPCGMLNVISK